jgi:hypothetical protein
LDFIFDFEKVPSCGLNQSDILERLVFTFDDIYPPCHSAGLTPTAMDVSEFYSPLCDDTLKLGVPKDSPVSPDHPTLNELDPSVELTCDLSKLIEQTRNHDDQHLFRTLLARQDSYKLSAAIRPTSDATPTAVNNQHTFTISEDALRNILPSALTLDSFPPSPEYAEVPAAVKLEPPSPHCTIQVPEVVTSTSSSPSSSPLPSPCGSGRRSSALKSPSAKSRRRQLEKGSEEYRLRRERNNVAVRKSRDKAKEKQRQTEGRVSILTEENERLQKKVDLLSKELTVLRGLFANVGVPVPAELSQLIS